MATIFILNLTNTVVYDSHVDSNQKGTKKMCAFHFQRQEMVSVVECWLLFAHSIFVHEIKLNFLSSFFSYVFSIRIRQH